MSVRSAEFPIRILHVIASIAARTGGPAKAAIDMARAVAARGHEVAIYTTDREMAAEERALYAPADRLDGVELRVFPQHAPAVMGTSFPLARALKRAVPKADVVHVHSLYLFHTWAAARLCKRFGVPYLLRPHGTLDPFIWRRHRARKAVLEWLFQNRVLRDAAAIHYTADDEMRLAAPYIHGAPGVVVPNGLDLEQYADLPPRGGFRALHPEIGNRRIVLFLSRLNFKKGLDVLIPAFARAARRFDDLHLVLAGPDDGERGAAEAAVAAEGIGARVTFAGMLDHRAKLACFRDAAMFVLPSYSENFGIAIVEALACGIPVAISDRVNIWREIEAAGAGLVAPPAVDPVARQIETLAADPGRAATMGERGPALVREKFAWSRIARELETVYRSLAADSTRPAMR
ncbi:MAG TPA: glycosyltransferase [Alphaproteobacteria bacterium]